MTLQAREAVRRAGFPSMLAAAPQRHAGSPTVSAAICTRNRPMMLARALCSLSAQRQPPEELLVIDNASDDDATANIVHQQFPDVRYVREAVQGLDVARNRALSEARGDVVAFLDDDAVVDVEWVQRFREAFHAAPRMAVCTSRVEALSLATPAQRLFEANGGFSRGQVRVRLPEDARRGLRGWAAPRIAWAVSVGNGASFAVRREAIQALGGFDPALDLGEALPGGGDLDLFWRALQAGWQVVYEPSVLAWHEHRADLASMTTQLAGHQRALMAFLCKAAANSPVNQRGPIMVFLCWRLVKPFVRLAKRAVGADPLPLPILWTMATSTWSGLWAYPMAQRASAARHARAGTGQAVLLGKGAG